MNTETTYKSASEILKEHFKDSIPEAFEGKIWDDRLIYAIEEYASQFRTPKPADEPVKNAEEILKKISWITGKPGINNVAIGSSMYKDILDVMEEYAYQFKDKALALTMDEEIEKIANEFYKNNRFEKSKIAGFRAGYKKAMRDNLQRYGQGDNVCNYSLPALPTEEDIRKEAVSIYSSSHIESWQDGAKWMRDKIHKSSTSKKPISEITMEDTRMVANIEGWHPNVELKNFKNFDKLKVKSFQYLESKGYELPKYY